MSNLISSVSPFGSPEWELYYGGQRLYPAPLVTFSRGYTRNAVDVALSYQDSWVLRGVYLNAPSGCFQDVVTGMESLKSIFSQDRLELVIKAGAASRSLPSGTTIVSGIYPYIESISIPERTDQFYRFDYEVTLTNKIAASGASGVIQSSDDSWSYEENQDYYSVTVNHTINAVGINTAPSGAASNAVSNAKAFVTSRTGIANAPSGFPIYVEPGAVSGVSGTFYELQRTRRESVNLEQGSYDISETFVIGSGTRPFSDTRTFTYDKDANGISTVNVQGTVQGFKRTDGTNTLVNGFTNAQSGFLNHVRPYITNDASGVYSYWGGSGILGIYSPTSTSISENRYLGTIAYSYTFTDDPAKVLPSGIVEQSLSVQRNDAIRVFVTHAIPFRRLGDILQDLATPTLGTITINATARSENTGDIISDVNRAISHVQNLINQNRPNPNEFITLRLTSLNQDNSKLQLTASATATYEFTVDLATVNTSNSDIILTPVS